MIGMRKSVPCAVVIMSFIIVLLSSAGCAGGDHTNIEESIPTMSVQGYGKIKAVPDEAILRFGVTSTDKSLSRAYMQNTEKMNIIIGRVEALGAGKQDVQTSSFSVRPLYERDAQGRQVPGKPSSFRVDQQVTVKIRDISKTSDVIDRVMDGGTNVFGGIQFASSRMEELRTEARIEAAKNAKKKAGVIAESLGVKAGRIVRITESAPSHYGPVMARGASMMAEAAPRIEPGSMEVTATCNVVYEIVQ